MVLRRIISALFDVLLVTAIGGGVAFAQSISIFGNAVPNNPIGNLPNASMAGVVTLGAKFWSSEPRTISGITNSDQIPDSLRQISGLRFTCY